jgi:exodeoxyribonuclease III
VHFHGQKGHYGVALLSRQPPLELHKGFASDEEDAQRRFIWGTFADENGQPVTIMNGYFPQGESRDHPTKFPAKQRFYSDLQQLLESRFSNEQPLVVMGDINISPQDCDIGIGPDNAKRWLKTGKCSFLPEEREWLERLKNWGLVDSFRYLHPDVADRFSWFDYRSRGFEDEPKRGLRIDVILTSQGLVPRIKARGRRLRPARHGKTVRPRADLAGVELSKRACLLWERACSRWPHARFSDRREARQRARRSHTGGVCHRPETFLT